MKNFVFLIFSLSVVMVACNQNKKMHTEIRTLESEVYSDSLNVFNPQKLADLAGAYQKFANEFPVDTATPDFLFKAGEIFMNTGKGNQAIGIFKKLQSEYPDTKNIPYCIFFQAFVYENQLNNIDQARIYYQMFIDRYPNHELSDDAFISIQNLGKSLEQILQEFQEKNQGKEI